MLWLVAVVTAFLSCAVQFVVSQGLCKCPLDIETYYQVCTEPYEGSVIAVKRGVYDIIGQELNLTEATPCPRHTRESCRVTSTPRSFKTQFFNEDGSLFDYSDGLREDFLRDAVTNVLTSSMFNASGRSWSHFASTRDTGAVCFIDPGDLGWMSFRPQFLSVDGDILTRECRLWRRFKATVPRTMYAQSAFGMFVCKEIKIQAEGQG